MTKQILPIAILLALGLTAQAAFPGEGVGHYTRFYSSQSGAAIATNGSSFAAWQNCDPEDASCVTTLPSEGLTQADAGAVCHLNYGEPNKFYFSDNNDAWNLLSTGSGALSGSWPEVICGRSLSANDFVIIFIFRKSTESTSHDSATAANYISHMRGYFIFIQDEHTTVSLEVTDNVDVVATWTTKFPAQASGVSYRPFLISGGGARFVSSWKLPSGVTGTFCQDPSEFSASDPNVGETFTFTSTIPYDTFVQTVTPVEGTNAEKQNVEVTKFTLEFRAYDCGTNSDYDNDQKIYRSNGEITYNRSVEATSAIASDSQSVDKGTVSAYLEVESFLKFCEQSDCSVAFFVTFHSFVVDQTVYAKLEVPASQRTFNSKTMKLADSNGDEILGGIEVTIQDDSKPGEVIFKVKFLKVYENGALTVEAEANAPARRFLVDDAEKITRSKTISAGTVKEKDTTGTSSGMVLSFSALFCLLVSALF